MHPSINILRSYEELEDDGFEEKVQWAAQETSGLWGGFLQLMKWWIPWIWPSHWRSDPTSSFAKRQKRPSSILGVGVLWNMILITEPVPQHNRNMIFYTMCVCGEAADDADIQQNCASAATLPKIIEEVENHPIVELRGSRFGPLGLLDPTRHIGLTDMPFQISTMNH